MKEIHNCLNGHLITMKKMKQNEGFVRVIRFLIRTTPLCQPLYFKQSHMATQITFRNLLCPFSLTL